MITKLYDLAVLDHCEFGTNYLDTNLDSHKGMTEGFREKYSGVSSTRGKQRPPCRCQPHSSE